MLDLRYLIILSLLCSSWTVAYTQKIDIVRPGVYHVNGVKQDMLQMHQLMSNSSETEELWRKTKTPRTFAKLTGFVGGFGLGWALGNLIRGGVWTEERKATNRNMAAIGLAGIVTYIPFNTAANIRSKQAIEVFNQGQAKTQRKSYWEVGQTEVGLALRYTF